MHCPCLPYDFTNLHKYINKINFCTFLIPIGCPLIRGREQSHSPHCIPEGFKTGRAQREVSNVFFSSITPIQEVSFPSLPSASLRISASRRGTFDVGERHDPMIRTYVIIGEVLGRGKGCCWMFESTVKLSSETDASFYNAGAFEIHIQTALYSARMGAAGIE